MEIEFIIMKEHSGFSKIILKRKLSKHSNLENILSVFYFCCCLWKHSLPTFYKE